MSCHQFLFAQNCWLLSYLIIMPIFKDEKTRAVPWKVICASLTSCIMIWSQNFGTLRVMGTQNLEVKLWPHWIGKVPIPQSQNCTFQAKPNWKHENNTGMLYTQNIWFRLYLIKCTRTHYSEEIIWAIHVSNNVFYQVRNILKIHYNRHEIF